MHLEHEAGARPDRRLVVGEGRAVRRPDLDKARAGGRQQVRQPEAVADLDELTPADDDVLALRQRRCSEDECRCAVVDDVHRLGVGHGFG